MEVTIGVRHIARELTLEVDTTAGQLAEQISEAIKAGTILELTDTRGRCVVVPATAIGYVEIGPEEARRVGFGSL